MKKEIFAGIGLGLLVGTIIGLSIAEISGLILGALTSLLAAFFGLRASKDGESGNQIRIGIFCLSCLLSIFLGLVIRTHNLLAPSISDEILQYKNAQFDQTEIKKILLFKELGIIPNGFTFSKEAKVMNDKTILMSGYEPSVYLCSVINDSSSLEEIKMAYDKSGKKYQEIEMKLTFIINNPVELKAILIYLKTLLCNTNQ
jgi:hypothetical protein